MDFLKRLRQESLGLRNPKPPESLRQRVLAALNTEFPVRGSIGPDPISGELLRADRSLARRLIAGGGVGVVIAIALGVLIVPEVASDSTVLEFDNKSPSAGDVVEVTYRSNGQFSFGDEVILRAELFRKARPPWDKQGEYIVLDTLRKNRRGDYRGAFRWVDDVAMLKFGVESFDAEQVDSRLRNPWMLLAHDGDRPTFHALRQFYHDAFRSMLPRLSLTIARLATEYYADEPQAWDVVELNLKTLYGEHNIPDSLRNTLKDAFARLIRRSQDKDWATPARISELYWWAWIRNEPERFELRARMRNEAPLTHFAVQDRAEAIARDSSLDGQLKMQRLEALWQAAGPYHPAVALRAFLTAIELEDHLAALSWGRRVIDLQELDREWVITELLELEGVRDSAVTDLRAGLRELQEGQGHRRLYQTVSHFETTQSAKRRRLAALLGRTLIEQGLVSEGLGYLEIGVEVGWDSRAFRSAAEGYLSQPDSARAASYLARLALEDAISGTPSEAASLGRIIGGDSWEQLLADAEGVLKAELDRQLFHAAPYPDSAFVQDVDGNVLSLSTVLHGTPNVLVFAWLNAEGQNAIELLSRDAADRLAHGIRTFVVTDQLPNAEFKRSAERFSGVSWLHDVYGDAREYLGNWRVPNYYVLSADGTAQFRYGSSRSIPLQLAYVQSLRRKHAEFIAPD